MSDAENEERPRIKVTDRRMFDREGRLREDVPAEPAEKAPEPAGEIQDRDAAPTAPGPAAESGRPPEPEPASAQRGEPAKDPAARREDTRGGDQRISEARLQAAMDAEDIEPAALGGPDGGSAANLPRDFPAFIESQYYEALLFLGAMRHPATGQTVEDLDMARYKIDVLSMLRDKTDGNRTPEESQLLDDVLYQLRMAYLQKRKVPKL